MNRPINLLQARKKVLDVFVYLRRSLFYVHALLSVHLLLLDTIFSPSSRRKCKQASCTNVNCLPKGLLAFLGPFISWFVFLLSYCISHACVLSISKQTFSQ